METSSFVRSAFFITAALLTFNQEMNERLVFTLNLLLQLVDEWSYLPPQHPVFIAKVHLHNFHNEQDEKCAFAALVTEAD